MTELYKCPECDAVFTEEHWNEKSDEHFQSSPGVYRLSNLNESADFYCSSCDSDVDGRSIEKVESSGNSQSLVAHRETHQIEGEYFNCLACGGTFIETEWNDSTRERFGRGIEEIQDTYNNVYICPGCNYKRDYPKEIARVDKPVDYHKITAYKCPWCEEASTEEEWHKSTMGDIGAHANISTAIPTSIFTCPKCAESTFKGNIKTTHIKEKVNPTFTTPYRPSVGEEVIITIKDKEMYAKVRYVQTEYIKVEVLLDGKFQILNIDTNKIRKEE